MVSVKSISNFPEEIKELSLVDRIIKTIKYLSKRHKVEYEFVYIQQNHLGGTCIPVPKENKFDGYGCYVLGRYNLAFFENLRKKLQGKTR